MLQRRENCLSIKGPVRRLWGHLMVRLQVAANGISFHKVTYGGLHGKAPEVPAATLTVVMFTLLLLKLLAFLPLLLL